MTRGKAQHVLCNVRPQEPCGRAAMHVEAAILGHVQSIMPPVLVLKSSLSVCPETDQLRNLPSSCLVCSGVPVTLASHTWSATAGSQDRTAPTAWPGQPSQHPCPTPECDFSLRPQAPPAFLHTRRRPNQTSQHNRHATPACHAITDIKAPGGSATKATRQSWRPGSYGNQASS